MLIIFVAVIGFGYIIYECTEADISVNDLQGKIPRMQINNDIIYNALTESSNLRDYLLYGDEQYRVEYERIAQLNPKLEDNLINQATTETSRKLSADTKALDQQYTLIANTKVIPLLSEGNKEAAMQIASNELAPIEDQLLAKIEEAKVYRITTVSKAMDTANKASKLAEIVAVCVAILVTILGIIIGLLASNRITAWVTRDIANRKRLEKQLKEQVEYAELLFKTVPSAVISVDKNRKIMRWNKIAEEITGFTAADVIGKECSAVLHRTGKCEMCGMVNGSPLLNEKCEIVTKDGQIRHAFKSVAVLRDEFGEITERMGCFDDITELVNMEAELRESKERYAAIVNNAPQIVVIHKKGIVEFVNDAGIEVLGYEKDATINPHMKGLTIKELFGSVNSVLIEQIRGDACLSSEIELIKKSGEIIDVLLKGTGITYEGERAILAVMMDITENKRLNAKLRASEEKFKQLAETINEIFLISDMERIIYVNPAYERISGMSDQSLLDNQGSLVELIHPADRERMRDFILLGYQNMNETANEEFRIIRLDGEIRWLWLQSYPIRAEANNTPLKATCIVDITDRKKIEDKLREREKQTQRELLLAARVQRDSLPQPFDGNKVRVSTIFKPHSTVSGDFFNYKWFEAQNKLCGYIVDVSGHGVATALQTATFKMLLDNVLLNGEKIEEDTFQIINQRIMQYLYEGSFAALLYFEFDFQAATLKLISAGITLFLFANPQECSLEPISGCYLGIIDRPEIQIQMRALKAGDIYCLMSDGASDLIESRGLNKQGSIIEYKNWLEKLAESPDRNDDFTVVCIESLQVAKEIQVLDIKNVEDIERAQIKINEFLERNTPLHAPVLEIAINEAMNNGFKACGQVCIRTRRMGGKLVIRVKDFGPGFNTKEINIHQKKDLIEEQFEQILEAEGGRGILLMKLFCDRVIYNDKGNEVLLMKQIS